MGERPVDNARLAALNQPPRHDGADFSDMGLTCYMSGPPKAGPLDGRVRPATVPKAPTGSARQPSETKAQLGRESARRRRMETLAVCTVS